jgi:hypothetical protein
MTLLVTQSGDIHNRGTSSAAERGESSASAPASSSLRNQRAMALKVSATLRSVNLFPKTLTVSDADTLRDGRYKTIAFAICFAIASLVLVTFYATRTTVFQETHYRPTLGQYETLVGNGWVPSCTCFSAPRYQDAIDMHVPGYANFSLNACGTLMGLAAYFGNQSVYSRSETAALVFFNYLQRLSMLCDAQAIGTNLALSGAMPSEVGLSLLDVDTLNATLTKALTSLLDQGFAAGSMQLQPLSVAAFQPPLFRSNQAWGALSLSPPNCSCDPAVLFALPPSQSVVPCRFRAAFDTRADAAADAWWSCNLEGNIYNWPLALLTQEAFYTQFGIPPADSAQFQSFAGAKNVTAGSTLATMVVDAVTAYFPGRIVNTNYATLQPGLMTLDYPRYYAACAPQSCVVTYADTPDAIQLITIMLGVISGLQTVLMLVVDRGFEWLCRERCRRRAEAKRLAGRALGSVDGDGDGGGADSDSDDADAGDSPSNAQHSRSNAGERAPGSRAQSVSGADGRGQVQQPHHLQPPPPPAAASRAPVLATVCYAASAAYGGPAPLYTAAERQAVVVPAPAVPSGAVNSTGSSPHAPFSPNDAAAAGFAGASPPLRIEPFVPRATSRSAPGANPGSGALRPR